ncbi:MAG: carbamoyltransferase [Deltaproteobacteria bacterium]
MKILGLAAPFGHDASAALLVDGRIAAAAEEERFTRTKHARDQRPVHAVRYCLDAAGLKPQDIDLVAYPWSLDALRAGRWAYFARNAWANPSRTYKKCFRNAKEWRGQQDFVRRTLQETGFADAAFREVRWVEHHLAHAASSFYFSGARAAAVLSVDGGGEITSTLVARAAREGRIEKIKEIVAPDSLGNFYATMTDYLGFEREDGEYKVMGMAPFGDPSRVNLDHIIRWQEGKRSYRVNDDYVWVKRALRFRMDKVYSKKMVAEFGPERTGDGLSEPYIHIAAATQKKLEDLTLRLLETYLADELRRHGNLAFSGGCALNVSLNRRLIEHPLVRRLWVQPAAHDSGGSLGAAAYAAAQAGDTIEEMRHVYYGPSYGDAEIEAAIRQAGLTARRPSDICEAAAQLLKDDTVVGWFQGRMEWGPRALGNRSILGNPTIRGTNDRINAIIKFREKWRPFCPSILEEHGADILGSDHPSPFMTFSFEVAPHWKDRIPEAVHVDGTCRPQLVSKETNPRFHRLIDLFRQKTGIPLVINTSLNRRGEPMVCSPQDALLMFKESGLTHLVLGDFLIAK